MRVRKVLPDSAAAAAGLREGDILLQIGGRKIASVAAGRAALDGARGELELLEAAVTSR